jgi:hypothetical protein
MRIFSLFVYGISILILIFTAYLHTPLPFTDFKTWDMQGAELKTILAIILLILFSHTSFTFCAWRRQKYGLTIVISVGILLLSLAQLYTVYLTLRIS